MTCTTSIIITTFQRPHLLKWGLHSLAQQAMPTDFETIVLNDGFPDETESICKQYAQKLNLRYIFTGQRNLQGRSKWRVPGFAINIGAKLSQGKILILCCAEMFHLNDSIMQLSYPLLADPKRLGVPIGRDDQDASFLNYLNTHNGQFDYQAFYHNYRWLDTRLPFLTALSRDEFFAIGGYDEDFVGIGYEDNDFVERLLNNGCYYYQTAAEAIHLYHDRIFYGRENSPEALVNCRLYHEKKGQIVRNLNREWGKLLNA